MPELISTLMPQIKKHRIAGVDAGPISIYPAYEGYSLVNLPSTVCRWLGVPDFGSPPLHLDYTTSLSRRYRHIVVTLVDALGLDLFQQFLEQDPWKQWQPHAQLAPLTSITPSSTSSALASIWTGTAPSSHGILGYEMWLKEYGMIANMIALSPASFSGDPGSLKRTGFSPQRFLPVPTLGNHLAAHGVDVFALQPISIAYSGLSTMLLDGSEVIPYRNLSDLWVTLDSLLERQAQKYSYTYIYWGDIDDLSHRYGPSDERVSFEFEIFSRAVERFVSRRQRQSRGDTLWVMLADHGQISTPPNPRYDLHAYPGLLEDLVMVPSGENRLSYFFLRPGREDSAREYLDHTWPGEFKVMPSADALAAGLFGNDTSIRTAERLGEWIVFAQADAYLWWADKTNTLLGRHGGLSPQEMLVPFWTMEL